MLETKNIDKINNCGHTMTSQAQILCLDNGDDYIISLCKANKNKQQV